MIKMFDRFVSSLNISHLKKKKTAYASRMIAKKMFAFFSFFKFAFVNIIIGFINQKNS